MYEYDVQLMYVLYTRHIRHFYQNIFFICIVYMSYIYCISIVYVLYMYRICIMISLKKKKKTVHSSYINFIWTLYELYMNLELYIDVHIMYNKYTIHVRNHVRFMYVLCTYYVQYIYGVKNSYMNAVHE